jgi:large subunit ribosomal protein L25
MSSMKKFEIDASLRSDTGKGASRRLRHAEKLPGIVYGGGKEPVSLTLEHKTLAKALENEAFYSHILTLKTGSSSERVILKDLQRHPYRPLILHVDFQRIRADEKIHMHVPLHFIGAEEAPGVKIAGGIVSHLMNDVEVTCLPDDLPEYIKVDISKMELNDILHLSDLTLPKGVESIALNHGNDKGIVSIHMPRIEEEPVVEEEITPADVPAIEQTAESEGGEEK